MQKMVKLKRHYKERKRKEIVEGGLKNRGEKINDEQSMKKSVKRRLARV